MTLISAVLAIVMVFALVPFTVFATSNTGEEGQQSVLPQQEYSDVPTGAEQMQSATNPEQISALTEELSSVSSGQNSESIPQESKEELIIGAENSSLETALKDFEPALFSPNNQIYTTTSLSSTQFQTFKNIKLNTKPPELTLTLTIHYAMADLEGGRIEIPYGFTPSRDDQRFDNFEDAYIGKPFFVFMPDKTLLSEKTKAL